MEQSSKKLTKRFTIKVDEELHMQVKKRTVERRISMSTYILRAIIEQMKRDTKYES